MQKTQKALEEHTAYLTIHSLLVNDYITVFSVDIGVVFERIGGVFLFG
jgi:hypothetical protein